MRVICDELCLQGAINELHCTLRGKDERASIQTKHQKVSLYRSSSRIQSGSQCYISRLKLSSNIAFNPTTPQLQKSRESKTTIQSASTEMANFITLSALLAICCIFSSVHYVKSAPAALEVSIWIAESDSYVRATPSGVTADGVLGGR